MERFRQWVSDVERHQSGADDEASGGIASWSSPTLRDLNIELDAVLALVRTPGTDTFFGPPDPRGQRRQ
jgi:hypothetical protein